MKVKPILVKPTSSDALIAAAKKHKADIIVMASHRPQGVKRLLLARNPAGADALRDPGAGAALIRALVTVFIAKKPHW